MTEERKKEIIDKIDEIIRNNKPLDELRELFAQLKHEHESDNE